MGDTIASSSSLSVDCWQESIPVHQENRELKVLVQFQTVHFSGNGNEYHITLSSEEDPSFLYKTSVTAETYQRLVRYENLVTPFHQFPNYVHGLINAVRTTDGISESENFSVNILARGSATSREIEFLITARQRGCIVQSKRLSLCFHLASDVEFKEHLATCYERMRQEFQQQSQKVQNLERDVGIKDAKISELEQNQRWQQNQMNIMHGMLESAQNIQHHYETLLQQCKPQNATYFSDVGDSKPLHSSFSFSPFSKDKSENGVLAVPEDYSPGGGLNISEFDSVGQERRENLEQEFNFSNSLNWMGNKFLSTVEVGGSTSHGTRAAKSILRSDKKQGSLKGAAKRKAGPGHGKDTSQSITSAGVVETTESPIDRQESELDRESCIILSENVKQEKNETSKSCLSESLDSLVGEESLLSVEAENLMQSCSNVRSESFCTAGESSKYSNAECSPSFESVPGIGSYVKCQICDEVAAPDQDGLTAHLMKHVNESNKCQVCSDQGEFDSPKQLFYHMSSHTTRVFECSFCGKPGRLHYLKIHIRSHTGEKPYRCRVCNRGFADASTFRRHQRVHTGEKPYQCPICGRQIARKDNVKVHMRSHMKHQYPRCRKCGMMFLRRNEVEAHEQEGCCRAR